MVPKPLRTFSAWDKLNTPEAAVEPLLPYLPKGLIVWESAPGEGKLVEILLKAGLSVTYCTTADYFDWEPECWHIQVTNPPFSKKARWLQRANELGKPYAILLPVLALGSRGCQTELRGAQILFLPRRIDFTGKGRPWFPVAWYTRGLGLPEQLMFIGGDNGRG